MTFDACMIIYIAYIQYSVLWVFPLSKGVFNCFIHVLNVHFKFWAGQPIKKTDFYIYFECFEIINCFKIHKISYFIK